MRKTKDIVKPTTQFKNDYKQVIKHSLTSSSLEDVVSGLCNERSIPEEERKPCSYRELGKASRVPYPPELAVDLSYGG